MKRLAVFDMDGTLVNTAPNILSALHTVMKSCGHPRFEETEVIPVMGLGSQAILKAALGPRRLIAPATIEVLARDLETVYFGLPTLPSHMYPGALEALHELKARRYGLAVCTNKPQRLADAVLNSLAITPLFDALVGGDAIPYRKPDPRHLSHTISLAGGLAAHSVYVGDAHTDMLAAMGAGVHGIRFSGGYEAVTEDQVVGVRLMHAFAELPSLLLEIHKA